MLYFFSIYNFWIQQLLLVKARRRLCNELFYEGFFKIRIQK